MAGEQRRFAGTHPRSAALHETAKTSLLDGVPMPWMIKWAGPFPPYVESADGAHIRCVDGHDYIDLRPDRATHGHDRSVRTEHGDGLVHRAVIAVVVDDDLGPTGHVAS